MADAAGATGAGGGTGGQSVRGPGSFGPNAWLVDDMYDRFVADPSSVSESWREFFADYKSSPVPVAAPPSAPEAPAAPAPEATSVAPAARALRGSAARIV